MTIRRVGSALIGGLLFLAALFAAYSLGKDAYYSYYLFPKAQNGVHAQTRWQDFAALLALWSGVFLVLYISYRLLKYALH